MDHQLRTSEPTVHTVASLTQFFEMDVTAAIQVHYKDRPCQVSVSGVLGELAENSYQMYYGIQLRDGQDTVYLDIRKSITSASNIKGGEYVSVIGVIKTKLDQWTKGRVELRLDVSSIRAIDSPDAVEAMRRDQATMDRLKGLGINRHPFPFGKIPNISVVLARQSQVKPDFLYEVNKLGDKVNVEFVHANMTDSNDLVAGIKSANGDVLVLIRGGGDAEQFEVFNSMPVVIAINEHTGYRVLGLGHSGDATIADLVCDYSANTPAQAGMHIRDMMEKHTATIQQETMQLKATIQRMQDEYNKLRTEAEESSNEINRAYSKLDNLFTVMMRHWKPLLIIAIALFVAGRWLRH